MTNPPINEDIEETIVQETTVTCKRCGKVLIIRQEGDGIHTCSPKQDYVIPSDLLSSTTP